MDSYRDLGLKIIEAGKNGKLEDVEVSRMLYQLYEPMIYIDRFYAGVYQGEKPIKLETDIEAAKAKANRLYKDELYIMQYSDEILRHAKRIYKNADEVLKGTETNPMKLGIIKAWDMLSGYLVDWFDAFTEHEYKYNFGLISHIFVKADYHLETAYDGENKEIDFLVINEGYKAFNGTVQVLDEKGEKLYETERISVAPNEEVPVVLKFQIFKLEGQDTRKYTFSMVNDEGRLESKRNNIIEVKPMIEANILDCDVVPEEMENIQLNIKNLFALSYNVKVKVSSSDNLVLAANTFDVSLTENEDKIVDIPVSEIKNTKFHHYTIKYEVYDDNGTKIVEDIVPLSFLPITRASEPINPNEWDGDVSDWYDAYPIYRNYVDDPNNPEEYIGANLAVRIMKKWDEENLYILADVYYKDHSSLNTGSMLWDGDCIQISIDTENNGSLTEGPSERYKDDDFEIGFGLTGAGEEFYQWRGPVSNESGKVEWAKIIRNNDIGYTRYLVALNKNNFNLKLAEGGTVTFNVAVNEGDALGREFFYQITKGTADSKTPEWYYDYKLVAPTGKEYLEHLSENVFPLK